MKRVRFDCPSPRPTRVCSACGYRFLPRKTGERRALACRQCGAWECGHCARSVAVPYCDVCATAVEWTGVYPCW